MRRDSVPLPKRLPVLPIRDKVVFPNIQVSLVIGREKSIAAVKKAASDNQYLFITTQRNMKVEDPGRDDLYDHGTIAQILQISNLPDGMIRIQVSGLFRARLLELTLEQSFL